MIIRVRSSKAPWGSAMSRSDAVDAVDSKDTAGEKSKDFN